MMTDFVKWKPEHNGHKPPHWRDGMEWDLWPKKPSIALHAEWTDNNLYSVPREAVYGPAEKLLSWPEATAAIAGLNLSNATLSDLKQALSKHSAEELAKHGVLLAPEPDWATELWADAVEALGLSGAARSIRDGKLDAGDKRAIELIRSRVTPKDTGA